MESPLCINGTTTPEQVLSRKKGRGQRNEGRGVEWLFSADCLSDDF